MKPDMLLNGENSLIFQDNWQNVLAWLRTYASIIDRNWRVVMGTIGVTIPVFEYIAIHTL